MTPLRALETRFWNLPNLFSERMLAVSSLLEDSKGNLWIAMGTGASVQRLRDGAFTEFVHPRDEFPFLVMVEDAAGSIWMVSTGGRLLRVNGDAIVDETQRALQPGIYIQCLHTTSDGSLWIGYAGAGVGTPSKGNLRHHRNQARSVG